MKKNKKGVSIIIGMGLTVIITLRAYVILNYIIPFAKNIKGIENTTRAYYNAYSGIEKSLYHTKIRTRLTTETIQNMPATRVGYSYRTFSSGTIIPRPGFGNSEFNKDYNIISLTEPIQLEIGRAGHGVANLFDNSVNFIFKVPNFDNNTLTTETLSGNTTTPIINWLLSSQDDTLYATGSFVYVGSNQVNNSNGFTTWTINSKMGFRLNSGEQTFTNFYNTNCNTTTSKCSLKMSVVNKLFLTTGVEIPYLEYRITFPNNVPDRYTYIETFGKSYGFQKKLNVKVPQQTVNQAFDFTVFQ